MTRSPVLHALLAASLLMLPHSGGAQQPNVAARAAPFSIDVSGYYQVLDRGYSDWRGGDLRLAYAGERFSPFALASTQSRREGWQHSYGLGTYMVFGRHDYAIVDVSVATGGTAVFFPRLRWDATLLSDTRIVPGLVIATGYTWVSFGDGSSGSIASLGPIYYRGLWILSSVARLNHDNAGGATTGSAEAAGQYGREGWQWVGAVLTAGHEAYQVLAVTPFDVQFTNVGAAVFYQRWLTSRTAARVRLDYEAKISAYQRRGATLSYRVAF
jgi:YaiO family outer membrane protein